MSVLSSIIANTARPPQPFVLLQSSTAQSSLPVLQNLIAKARGSVLVACFLYPSKIFFNLGPQQQIEILDFRDHVPEYHDKNGARTKIILDSIQKLGKADIFFGCDGYWKLTDSIDSSLPLTVVIDSIEMLLSNTSDSISSTYAFLSQLYSLIQTHKGTLFYFDIVNPSRSLTYISRTLPPSSAWHWVIALDIAIITAVILVDTCPYHFSSLCITDTSHTLVLCSSSTFDYS